MNRRYGAAASAVLMLLQTVGTPMVPDANAQLPGESLIARYVATWELDAFFAEPAIAAELQALLGERLDEVMHALDVSTDIEYYGRALRVSGNAPHAGGEHEAIVCVQLFSTGVQVHVGHYVDGVITVYTRQPRYDFLPTCIKDWIGLENAAHAHRLRQPGNVRFEPR